LSRAADFDGHPEANSALLRESRAGRGRHDPGDAAVSVGERVDLGDHERREDRA
jgi:hypothetical protein